MRDFETRHLCELSAEQFWALRADLSYDQYIADFDKQARRRPLCSLPLCTPLLHSPPPPRHPRARRLAPPWPARLVDRIPAHASRLDARRRSSSSAGSRRRLTRRATRAWSGRCGLPSARTRCQRRCAACSRTPSSPFSSGRALRDASETLPRDVRETSENVPRRVRDASENVPPAWS